MNVGIGWNVVGPRSKQTFEGMYYIVRSSRIKSGASLTVVGNTSEIGDICCSIV